jgi:ABC-2 type transport system ATP-binding protein
MPDSVILVENLVKRYGKTIAVGGVSFAVERGVTTALLGGNGAGKTTTLSILLGLLLPTSGSVHVFGEDVLRHRYRVLPRMNFSSPYVDLPHRLTVRQNLVIYARLYGVPSRNERIARLAQDLQIEPMLDRPAGRLSGGQKTRVALAKALLNEPELLLLDEPTASLDPAATYAVEEIIAAMHNAGCKIVMTTHDLAQARRLVDEIVFLHRGRILEKQPAADFFERPATSEATAFIAGTLRW